MSERVPEDNTKHSVKVLTTPVTAEMLAAYPGKFENASYAVIMRDESDSDGLSLIFTPDEWEAFTLGVQDGEFDVDEEPETKR